MASYFRTSRNVELSLLYYLDTNLATDWAGTTVEKSFKQVYTKNISLPVVCIRLSDTNSVRKEVGNTTLEDRYLLIIDIFATSDGMRLDMADYIKGKLSTGWVHYSHSHASGDNTTLSRTANGRDTVTEWLTDARIDFTGDIDEKDKFRHNISIRARHSI